MTRRLPWISLLATFLFAVSALAQTTPAGPSRYAPRAAGQPVQIQPGTQPSRASGPQVFGPQQQVRQAQATGGMTPIRQASDQQPIRPPVGNAAPAAPVAPQQPSWFPLEAAQQQWVDQILAWWERESGKIKTFECKFDRFDYDPVFGPKTEAKTIAQGVIKYAQPDKGLYEVKKLFSYVGPPKIPGEKSEYAEQDATFGEHWVCDGKQIHSFEAPKKQVTVSQLPPELQGKAIVDGPLPFLFGARAETIKARYWIRVLPETGNGKFWLEAVPKSRQDAQNFKFIHIVLDEKKFLPETLFLFAPNFDPQKNPSRTTHIFKDIKTDSDQTLREKIQGGLDPLKLFTHDFYNVSLPRGWKRVVDGGLPVSVEPPLEAKSRPETPNRSFPALPR
jgi:TIGR03009 family protein